MILSLERLMYSAIDQTLYHLSWDMVLFCSFQKGKNMDLASYLNKISEVEQIHIRNSLEYPSPSGCHLYTHGPRESLYQCKGTILCNFDTSTAIIQFTIHHFHIDGCLYLSFPLLLESEAHWKRYYCVNCKMFRTLSLAPT